MEMRHHDIGCGHMRPERHDCNTDVIPQECCKEEIFHKDHKDVCHKDACHKDTCHTEFEDCGKKEFNCGCERQVIKHQHVVKHRRDIINEYDVVHEYDINHYDVVRHRDVVRHNDYTSHQPDYCCDSGVVRPPRRNCARKRRFW